MRYETILVRVLADATSVLSQQFEWLARNRRENVPHLGRLACTVTSLLVDADQQRVGVVRVEVLQRRRMLERVQRHDAVVVYTAS